MVQVIEDLAGDWRRLDERVESLSSEIEAIARQDAGDPLTIVEKYLPEP